MLFGMSAIVLLLLRSAEALAGMPGNEQIATSAGLLVGMHFLFANFGGSVLIAIIFTLIKSCL